MNDNGKVLSIIEYLKNLPPWPTEIEVLELALGAKRRNCSGFILWCGGKEFAAGDQFYSVRALYRLLRRCALKEESFGDGTDRYYSINSTGEELLSKWKSNGKL